MVAQIRISIPHDDSANETTHRLFPTDLPHITRRRRWSRLLSRLWAVVADKRARLFILLLVSIFLNVLLLILSVSRNGSSWSAYSIPKDIAYPGLATGAEDSRYHMLAELIVVPGHAVFLGNPYDKKQVKHSEAWSLESFQSTRDIDGFLEHIHTGIAELDRKNRALLMFSGGQTKIKAGLRSEAQSYWEIAQGQKWLSSKNIWRTTTEEFARDSFENLLFSLCRFYEVTGRYPSNVTFVGYPFKRNRFTNLHRVALKLPATKFHYVDSPANDDFYVDAEKTRGEFTNAYRPFEIDPYGCTGILQKKRKQRNPFHRQ
ncbi:hypothetical protein IWQ62_000385 [Dispira parvispora]|uniref:DUF218 domain-containing protein n=1 Tax=Dispira parvispora TaxID=1520584 RepID=A0A9W8AYH4_9FUNG|nr:hypothetical protein IWQ62_000385 [Dispira parvispora]